MKINLSVKKSIEQSAQVYFEKSKKAKKKLEGARKALVISLKKKEKEEKSSSAEIEKIQTQVVKKKRPKKWYEKFRWFITSDGFLCIGGRDATTNEIIIKKQTDKDDVVCHTDMAGSPFFVIKKNSQPDKEITEETIQEAIDATFMFSRAWKLGLMTSNVFYVKPEQVTKKAQSGEFLPKGAFMIRGKTNYINPRNNLAVGKYEDTVMVGPLDAIKANCKDFVELIQGNRKASDIGKVLRKKLGGELDDIIASLPPGQCEIK